MGVILILLDIIWPQDTGNSEPFPENPFLPQGSQRSYTHKERRIKVSLSCDTHAPNPTVLNSGKVGSEHAA